MSIFRVSAVLSAIFCAYPAFAQNSTMVAPPPLRPETSTSIPIVAPTDANRAQLRGSPAGTAASGGSGAGSGGGSGVVMPLNTLPPAMRASTARELMDEMLPLTPEEIAEWRRRQDAARRANLMPTIDPPGAVSRSIEIQPGRSPQSTVRIFPGHATSIIFTDSTGSPWPVANVLQGSD